MCVTAGNFVIYRFYPLPLPIARTFPWDWKVSVFIAVVIAIPSGYLMYRGVRDAGEETLRPREEHSMYGGIYERIRHPQAVGEFPLFGRQLGEALVPLMRVDQESLRRDVEFRLQQGGRFVAVPDVDVAEEVEAQSGDSACAAKVASVK